MISAVLRLSASLLAIDAGLTSSSSRRCNSVLACSKSAVVSDPWYARAQVDQLWAAEDAQVGGVAVGDIGEARHRGVRSSGTASRAAATTISAHQGNEVVIVACYSGG